MIAAVDEFVLYDDVQFTKGDWRNRNKVKTPKGTEWISIPVGQKISRRICDVTLLNSVWQDRHWKTLEANYRRAKFFAEVAELIEPLYRSRSYTKLSELNEEFIGTICRYLNIRTKISHSWDYSVIENHVERLIEICAKTGAHDLGIPPEMLDMYRYGHAVA